MLNKKLIILTIIVLSLLFVSAVNATDNLTEEIIGVDNSENVTFEEIKIDSHQVSSMDVIKEDSIYNEGYENSNNEKLNYNKDNDLELNDQSIIDDNKTATLFEFKSEIKFEASTDSFNNKGTIDVVLKDVNNKSLANKSIHVVDKSNEYDMVSDENGTIKIQINLRNEDSYNILCSFEGDSNYNPAPSAIINIFIGNDAPAGSFKDLDYKIRHNSSIILERDYIFNSTCDSKYLEGIKIDMFHSIIIDGNGYTIDGNNESKIFNVESANSILKNIKFKNSFSSSSYQLGAISIGVVASNCIIENCSFMDISVKYGVTAISCSGINVTIKNCHFIDNYASIGGKTVYIYGRDAHIINCTFINNFGSYYIIQCNKDRSIMENCLFVNNSVLMGEIVNWKGNENVLSNCSFVNNFGSSNGAVYWSGNEGILQNCSFINNSGRYAGAIYLSGSDRLCNNCLFVNNSALNSGGAITLSSSQNLVNCSFVNNSALDSGGAISGFAPECNLVNCSFVNNSALNSGGAISWYSSHGCLVDCYFINNSVSQLQGEGGAIHWNSNYAELKNCSFVNNSAYGGSAISLYGNNSNLNNCSFDNNYAYGAGAAIYLSGNGCYITDSSFTNNNASILAGAIYSVSNNNIFSNCYFFNNSAPNGGAIIINNDDNGLFYCSFVKNSASKLGGAIYVLNNNSIIDYCLFVNNSANYGGAILINGNNSNLNNNSFVNNSAYSSGGATYCMGNEIYLTNSSFVNNNAQNFGGAVFWGGDDGLLTNCSFIDNFAALNASSVYWYGNNGNLINSTFIDNKNNNLIYWWNNENGNIEGCEFINNTNSVISNGAKFIRKNVNLTYSNSSFDFRSPTITSVYLINILDEFPIKSQIIFYFIKDNDSKNFTTDLKNNSASICDELFDLEAGNWQVIAIFPGDSNYDPCNTTFSIAINPILSSLILNVSNATVGHETMLISNVSSLINSTLNEGVVTYYDNGLEIDSDYVVDGVATLTYIPTTDGEHTITAIYNSNNYISSNNTAKLLVDSACVEVLVTNGTVGFESNFIANVKGLYSIINEGTVSFYINDNFIDKVNVVDGSASLIYTPLSTNNYTVKAVFNDSDNFLDDEDITNYTVNKADSSLVIDNVNGTMNHELVLTVNIVSSNNFTISEGAVTFVDGGTVVGQVNVVDGVATLTYTPTTDGEHTITAIYNSNNYLSSNGTAKLLVDSVSVEVLVENGTVGFNSNFIANVKGLYSIINEGSVIFYIDNTYIGKSPVVEGSACFNYTPLNANTFVLKAVYCDNEKFLNVENTSEYIVNKADSKIIIEDINATVGHEIIIKANIISPNNLTINEGIISFSENGDEISAFVVKDGVASLSYTPKTAGEHKITATYFADNYQSSDSSYNFIVNKASTELAFNNIGTVGYQSASSFIVNIKSDSKAVPEGKVKFYIDNSERGYKSVENGVAAFDYVSPGAGTFDVLAIFEETDNYLSSNATSTFTVNKLPSKIIASDLNTVYNSGQNLVVTLKDINDKSLSGVALTVLFNGETLNLPTDENGQCELSTKGLIPKSYPVTISFDGNTNYEKSSIVVNIVIKKATPKLTAKAKTFKKSVKTKKYSIVLKTNKNKAMKKAKMTIKVNGKKYKAKTNAKGKATFKITKLTKKGKYKATITYKGSSYYNKLTKQVKIKIK